MYLKLKVEFGLAVKFDSIEYRIVMLKESFSQKIYRAV